MPLQAGSSKLSLLIIDVMTALVSGARKGLTQFPSLKFDICPMPSLTCCKINVAVKQSAQLCLVSVCSRPQLS